LFATELNFVHPYTQQLINIKAPLGEAMLSMCTQLGWPNQEKDY
ncbi:tRNA pseudouridine(65) synthase TruC, partial [Streptococcus pneumoniae]|nr:tRNA pseudouridine(65) synthase TruC [Streptococcus pneumoniae]